MTEEQQVIDPSKTPHRRRVRRKRHRRKIWPWVVGIIVALVVVFAVAGGILGVKLLNEAKQVRDHENQALTALQGASNLNDVSQETLDSLPKAQEQSDAAKRIAHSSLWNFAAKVPYVGTNISTVQGMTDVVSDVVNDSLPQFLEAFKTLSSENLASSDGINLKPIVDAEPGITKANKALQREVQQYNNLPAPTISIISNAYNEGHTKLNELADKVDGLANTFTMLPVFLGQSGKQTYAVMAMTTSEMRSSGGLIGSVGEMTTDNGVIDIGDFKPNTDYIQYGAMDVTADEKRIFQDEGPLHMSYDIRDLAVYPDTQGVAEGMRTIWNRTPWGKDNPLDGVVLVDPVFVQELVAINGDITLDNGTVLTSKNTAEYLLNTVYKEHPDGEADPIFAYVAMKCIDDMFQNITVSKLAKLADTLDELAKERHFSMYSFNSDMETKILAAGFTATTPVDETHPEVGIYLTEQNPSKLGWYIKRTSKITCLECEKDGSCTYHVEYTLKNTMTAEEAKTLPNYIASIHDADRGVATEKILFYPPAGGSITNIVELNGSANAVTKDTLNGTTIYRTLVKIPAGDEVTYSFDVTTSDKAKTKLGIDQTPMGWTGDGVTYEDDKQ
ncbi:MAG: DUF4012 domain-containing protein [Bifidobacterium sp.]|nr:DUF4012 domain-containing protein [Bifidobacterium sp.]